MTMHELNLNFSKLDGLVPAIIQHIHSGKVLMLGFMNQEALKQTLDSGKVTFFSRTRNKLWTKGEESGNFLYLKKVLSDCDSDTLLILAEPAGPVCHTGEETCFGNENDAALTFLSDLQQLINTRKEKLPENSYTTMLFKEGINRIAQKVGEEAVELIIESKDNDQDLFLNEAADLLYHLLVLLTAKNSNIQDVIDILKKRHKK